MVLSAEDSTVLQKPWKGGETSAEFFATERTVHVTEQPATDRGCQEIEISSFCQNLLSMCLHVLSFENRNIQFLNHCVVFVKRDNVQSLEINYSSEYFWGWVITFATNFLFVPPTSHLYGIHLCSLLLNSCFPHNSEHICTNRATHSFALILWYKMTKLSRSLWNFFSMKHMTLCTAYNFLTASQ